jgi:quinol monooxygenase YgiN
MSENLQTSAINEVIVTLNLQFRPGTLANVLQRLIPAVHQTRAEPGCVQFDVWKVKNVEAQLIIFERWKNQAALDLHWQQSYTKDALALFDEFLARPLSPEIDVSYLEEVAPL